MSCILLLPLTPTSSPLENPLLVSPLLHSSRIGLPAISRTHQVRFSLMAFALDGPLLDRSALLASSLPKHPFSMNPTLQRYLDGEFLPRQPLQSPLFCSFFFSHGLTSRELYNVLMYSFQHMCLCLFFSICPPYQKVNSTRLRALCFVHTDASRKLSA